MAYDETGASVEVGRPGALDREAIDPHTIQIRGSGRVVVVPGGRVERARREHGDREAGSGRETRREQARGRLGPAGDFAAVAGCDDGELHRVIFMTLERPMSRLR